nr:MAG TPA: hypothetical protein [Caudoviricetes sp.]
MGAVKFLQERNRMFLSGAATPGIELEDDFDPVIAVGIVEKWSEQHPRRTRQSVFLKQWPMAVKDCDGVIFLDSCRVDVRAKSADCVWKTCSECRREFWMQEVE